MNLDIENMVHAPSNRHGKSASKGLGGMKENLAKESMLKNHFDAKMLNDQTSRLGRVKLGVLAKSNVAHATPLRNTARDDKDLKNFAGDDLDQFVKSTSNKPSNKVQYPPIEYGYVTKLDKAFDDDIIIREPELGTLWEVDEEDELRRAKDISDDELEAILDWI